MPNLKIGVRTAPFRLPLRQALAEAARTEAEGIELDLRDEVPLVELSQTGTRQIRKWLDDHRVRLAAVRFPTRRTLADPSDLERRLAAIQRAMQAGYELGARLIVVPGGIGALDAAAAADQRLREATELLTVYSQRIGVRVALQPATIDPEAARALLADAPETVIGWAIDTATLVAEGQTLGTILPQIAAHCAHVYVSDGYRDFATRQFVRTELGRGSVDLAELVGMLDGTGYRDWYMVEPTSTGDTTAAAADAIAYLRNL